MIQLNQNPNNHNNKSPIKIWLTSVLISTFIFILYRRIITSHLNSTIQFNILTTQNQNISLQFLHSPKKNHQRLNRLKIDPTIRQIRDDTGQQIIFHGVNVVYKSKPYIPNTNKFDPQESFNQKDIKDLSQLGFNFVRLGVSWESVETSPNQFNYTYLNQVETLIDNLGQQGIYTMIDIHQDVGAKIICGHGFPNFYSKQIVANSKCKNGFTANLIKQLAKQFGLCKSIKDYKYQTDDDGNPLPSECKKLPFAKYYGSTESLTLFDALYTNKHQFRDKFIRFWKIVVQKFAGNTNVMGFDPLNEPFVSNFINDISLIFPKNFDRNKLLPLYSEMYEILQKYDKKAILHFEVAPVPNVIATMGGIVNNAGYDRLPGQLNQTNFQINHVMHDHFYCCQTSFNMCNSKGNQGQPKDDHESEQICQKFHQTRMNKRIQDADNLKIPFMVTEFGACYNNQVCLREINQILDQCERKLCAGWAYWQFKNFRDTTTVGIQGAQGFYDLDGFLQIPKVKALSRPYQRKTQGTLLKYNFDIYDRIFESRFIIDLSLKNATTEIFVNSFLWYPNRNDGANNNRGFLVYVENHLSNDYHIFPQIEYLDQNNIININFSKTLNHDKQTINIYIKPYRGILDFHSQSNSQKQFKDSMFDMDFEYNTDGQF